MEARKRWNRIRWMATAVYLGITGVLTLGMILSPENEESIGIIMSLWVIGAMIPFLFLLAYPSMKGRKGTDPGSVKLEKDLVRIKKPKNTEIHDTVAFLWLFFIITLAILVVQGAITIAPLLQGDSISLEALVANMATLAFIAVLGVVFHKLDIHVDEEVVHFHWGPFGKKLRIEDIIEIRPVSVHPLRDFMGWGIRSGSDGSVGYISFSRFGVRITTEEGRSYTVSTNCPMEITQLVRWYKEHEK